MSRPLPFSLGLLTLVSCGESPTQPEMAVDPAPLASAVALASNTWTPKAAYPAVFGAVGLSLGMVPNAAGESIVYSFGGTDDEGGSAVSIRAYNVATNTWTTKSYEPRVDVFNTNGVGKIGSKLYFSGGRSWNGGSEYIDGRFWVYNPATNTLTEKARPPKLTADGVTGVIDGKLYVLPGTCSADYYPGAGYCEFEPFRRLFRYNPATNKWATKRSAPHYHTNGAGGVINGKFYVAGGTDDHRQPVAALDRYDPLTDTWKTLAPLPTAGRAVGTVLQGKLFVIVSKLKADFTTELRAYAYNPATNTWTPRAAPNRGHPAIVRVTLNGKPRLFAAGGIRYDPSATPNESELYTP
jgi:N-acetylneuraminic acid mutarotase